MIYDFSVQEPYKSFLLSGEKTVEVRLKKGKFQSILPGDVLMMDTGEKFLVTDIREYKNFYDLIQDVGIQNVIPDKNEIAEGVQICYQFYTKEMEEMYGVVGIGLRLL